MQEDFVTQQMIAFLLEIIRALGEKHLENEKEIDFLRKRAFKIEREVWDIQTRLRGLK